MVLSGEPQSDAVKTKLTYSFSFPSATGVGPAAPVLQNGCENSSRYFTLLNPETQAVLRWSSVASSTQLQPHTGLGPRTWLCH